MDHLLQCVEFPELIVVDAGLYHKLKYRAVSFVGNIPGYQGRKLSVSLYRMARKIYKFN